VTAIALHLFARVLHGTLLVYAILVCAHFFVQTFFAHRNYLASIRRARRAESAPAFTPSVDVIVPVYNESVEDLDACLASLAGQRYGGELRFYVVDDGSPNRDELLPLYARYRQDPRFVVVLAAENGGKRHAQDLALDRGRGEIVVTIDSDTQIDPDGVRVIVRPFVESHVGAVTGDVGVANATENLLTRLIGMRYWIAFNQERAAQGMFSSVLCCSGPFAAYRRVTLEAIWPSYVSQTFRGIACTYGDDRHLTNLVLSQGLEALYEPLAHAITTAPTTLRGYLKQQLRWNKSFYRELLWTLPFLASRSWYLTFEVVVQTILPFLLMLAILAAAISAIFIDPRYLVRYAIAVAVMAVIRCTYAIARTRDPRFFLFVLYGFLHAGLLVPVRIRALTSLTDTSWGTRAGAPQRAAAG
jgi:hyaluronan synthase/N-acetylglucosaminyltransferase